MQIKRKKRLTISIILTIIMMVCLHPLYMSVSTENIFRARHNKEARLNIFFSGNKDNQLELLHTSRLVKSEQPDWYNNPSWIKAPGQGTMVQAKIYRQYRKIELEYKAIGDGTVTIYLLGPHNKWDNGKLYPVWVYYKDFEVNGQKIFQESKKVNYDNGYEYKLELKNGEEFRLSFEAKRSLPLNIVSNIEPLLFFSFFVISFLLSRLIVYWLGKFKIFEHNSRIDIVFLSVFFVLLLLPMSKIDHSEKSVQENRMLAKYIPMIDGGGVFNQKYGRNFEAWFNDRFNLRQMLINMHTSILLNLNKYYETPKAYIGKNNWLIDKGMSTLYLSKQQQIKLSDQIEKLLFFCEQHNIKLYIMFTPVKIQIYPEIGYLKKIKDNENDVIRFIQNRNHFKILTINSELLSAKTQNYIFFKTDHHWTEWGAYIGYQYLMKEIQKDFPDVPMVNESDYDIFYSNKVRSEFGRDFHNGSLCKKLNLNKNCKLTEKYKYYRHKNFSKLKSIIDMKKGRKQFYYPDGADNRVILMGNSMGENLLEFLPYSFKNLKRIRTNWGGQNQNLELQMVKYEKEILDFKPDILIFVFHSSYAKLMDKMY